LDDFGTGYSSLNYLASLPLSVVKIDRSFIVQLLKKQEYRTLIHLIVDAAHALQLHVVAEGVETIEELQFLEHVNTDYIQGYYFSKPLSEADAYVLIENSL
ncbi:MAG: EAL domain-containing protein, partial [Culicoidibacterales bacterium]